MRNYFSLAIIASVTVMVTTGNVSAQDKESESAVSKPDSVRKYRFLGKTSRDKNDPQAVLDYYTELLKYQDEDRRTMFYIARANLKLGHMPAAKQAFVRAAELDSTHGNTCLSLYQIYSAESKPDSAWVYLERLLRQKPGDVRLLGYERKLGDLHRRKSETDKALDHYEALAVNPALGKEVCSELAELIAILYADMGEADSALVWRQRMLGGDDVASRIDGLRKMVDLQVETGDYKAAARTLKKLTDIDVAGRYSHFLRLAELGERHGDDALRLVGLEGMARVQPDDLENIATLVQFQMQADDPVAARRWIEAGLARSSTDAQLLILKGDLLFEDGRDDEAVASFELAKADPNWATVAQQRIWQIKPPETDEERLRREFFGNGGNDEGGS